MTRDEILDLIKHKLVMEQMDEEESKMAWKKECARSRSTTFSRGIAQNVHSQHEAKVFLLEDILSKIIA